VIGLIYNMSRGVITTILFQELFSVTFDLSKSTKNSNLPTPKLRKTRPRKINGLHSQETEKLKNLTLVSSSEANETRWSERSRELGIDWQQLSEFFFSPPIWSLIPLISLGRFGCFACSNELEIQGMWNAKFRQCTMIPHLSFEPDWSLSKEWSRTL
jgi:hypothetical protein